MRVRDAVRLCYGVALLGSPDRLAAGLAGADLGQRSRFVVRLLGARHVVQTLAVCRHDSPILRRADRMVDLLHAASMLLLAVLAPGRERLALTDAAIELVLAGPGGPRRTAGSGRQTYGLEDSPQVGRPSR